MTAARDPAPAGPDLTKAEGQAESEQMAGSDDLARLDGLSTEELRQRAFALARSRHDLSFFWSIFKHLPHADDAENLDGSLGSYGASVDDAVSLWKEFTGHRYGDEEPLVRAAFIDYLRKA